MATNVFPTGLIPSIIGFAKEVMSEEFSLARRMNNDFSGASGKIGTKVNIGVVASGSDQDITPANVAPDGAGISTSDRELTISRFRGSEPVSLSSTEAQNYDLTSLMQEQIKESIRQVSFGFNAFAWQRMNLRTPHIAGTAGQSIFNDGSSASIDPLADVFEALRDRNADPDRFDLVTTVKDEGNVKKVTTVKNANNFGAPTSSAVDGAVAKVNGFNLFVDQQVPSHVIGTITTGLIAKAATAQAVGTTALVCTTAASTGACDLNAGDNLTVDGEEYVLQADATEASAATDVTLTIFPGLKTALTGSEAVTITTGAGSAFTEVAGDLRGIAAVARLPELSFFGGMAIAQGTHIAVTDPKSALTMLLSFYGQSFQGMFQASLVYGIDVMDEDKIVKVFTHA